MCPLTMERRGREQDVLDYLAHRDGVGRTGVLLADSGRPRCATATGAQRSRGRNAGKQSEPAWEHPAITPRVGDGAGPPDLELMPHESHSSLVRCHGA